MKFASIIFLAILVLFSFGLNQQLEAKDWKYNQPKNKDSKSMGQKRFHFNQNNKDKLHSSYNKKNKKDKS